MTDKEKAPYHKIMVDSWRIFIKERLSDKYSDAWWEDIIGEFRKLREPYVGTRFDDYVCHISQVFLDEYERGQKRERQNRIPETVLSNTQERNPTEIQFSDSVSKVGGCEEIVEPFT